MSPSDTQLPNASASDIDVLHRHSSLEISSICRSVRNGVARQVTILRKLDPDQLLEHLCVLMDGVLVEELQGALGVYALMVQRGSLKVDRGVIADREALLKLREALGLHLATHDLPAALPAAIQDPTAKMPGRQPPGVRWSDGLQDAEEERQGGPKRKSSRLCAHAMEHLRGSVFAHEQKQQKEQERQEQQQQQQQSSAQQAPQQQKQWRLRLPRSQSPSPSGAPVDQCRAETVPKQCRDSGECRSSSSSIPEDGECCSPDGPGDTAAAPQTPQSALKSEDTEGQRGSAKAVTCRETQEPTAGSESGDIPPRRALARRRMTLIPGMRLSNGKGGQGGSLR